MIIYNRINLLIDYAGIAQWSGHQPSKLGMRVRFSLPAPKNKERLTTSPFIYIQDNNKLSYLARQLTDLDTNISIGVLRNKIEYFIFHLL